MDVKFSRDLRNLFNELGYDSIIYNNEGEKSVVLFEPGQTRKLSASPQNETEMSREKYFAGGAILAALLRNRNKEERKVRTVERGDTLSEIAEEQKVDINRLIKEKLDWDYSMSLEEGLEKTYEWISRRLNSFD